MNKGGHQPTRRRFLSLSIAVALAACMPLSRGQGRDGEASPCPLTAAQLKDKIMGMLLLGAYGDALGAPHEQDGLGGQTGDPATARRLRPFRDYDRDQPSAWGIWPNPADIDPNKRGVPTDDTSFRVAVLHQWLCDEAKGDERPTEARFLQWLRARQAPAADAPQWEKSRHQQIQAWICMLEDAMRMKQNPDGFQPRACNPFFRQNIPVVFGPFMYLELAAIYACCPRDEVFNRFESFSCLDQSYGQYITGVMTAMLSQAMCKTEQPDSFDQWYRQFVEGLLGSALGDAGQRRTVRAAYNQSRQFGQNNRNLSEKDFIEKLKTDIYDAPLPAPGDRQGLRNFDPLLFFKQMTAAVTYAGGDVRKALRILAVGPGDADTIPSQLGSIIGACMGEQALRQLGDGFSADFDAVKDCIKQLYGIELSDLADYLVTLADKQGCCKRRD